MNLDGVIESLPSYAKDLKLNFSSVVRQQSELTESKCGELWLPRLSPHAMNN